MTSQVQVIVSGDADTAEIEADSGVPLAALLAPWARRCSHRSPDDLVLVSADGTTALDPARTLADLGLGYGSVIRLVPQADRPPDRAPWPPPDSQLTGAPDVIRVDATQETATQETATQEAAALRPPGPGPDGDAHLPAKVPKGRRLWAALRAGVTRSSSPAPPIGTFAKPTQTSAGQRYRTALQATDRVHNLEAMIRSAPLDRCVVVAIVSPKGGPGKTTVTALLGTLLAELRRDPVVALDANPDLGDLKDKLAGNDRAALVDDLAAWLHSHPNATPAELWRLLGVGPHGLRYIATPRPPECTKERMIEAADFDLYETLITRMRDYAGIILVDCGTGLLDPPVRAALGCADQIVLITDSSATTARQVVAASGLLPPTTPTWLVANKMPQRGSMLDLDQVVAAIPRLKGVTVIPVPSGGKLAENIVNPDFTWSEAPAEWQEPARELAARLARSWSAPAAVVQPTV